MYTIGMVGAGQLGSRHLQALARCGFSAEITVIDPSRESLDTARERYNEIGSGVKNINVSYNTDLDTLPRNIDLCIVATASKERADVTASLLQGHEVRYILFEKVLFGTVLDYERIRSLLKQKGTSAWVNCPRRIYPFYLEAKDRFLKDKRIFCSVCGGEWGLGSNAVHLIDLAAFMAGDCEYEIDTSGLDDTPLQSKRPGYIELSGTLRGTFSNGSEFVLHASRGSNAPHLVHLSGSREMVIDETAGIARVSGEEGGWKWEQRSFKVPYQSELTHLVAKDILEGKRCGLTPFDESVTLHLPLIKGIICRFGTGRETCPIT
jgi:hypothetical protein